MSWAARIYCMLDKLIFDIIGAFGCRQKFFSSPRQTIIAVYLFLLVGHQTEIRASSGTCRYVKRPLIRCLQQGPAESGQRTFIAGLILTLLLRGKQFSLFWLFNRW